MASFKIYVSFIIAALMGASCTVHRGSKDREYAAGYRYKYTDPSTEGDSVLIVGQIMNRIPGKEKKNITVVFNSYYYKESEQTVQQYILQRISIS